jgi:hypothetical protein
LLVDGQLQVSGAGGDTEQSARDAIRVLFKGLDARAARSRRAGE